MQQMEKNQAKIEEHLVIFGHKRNLPLTISKSFLVTVYFISPSSAAAIAELKLMQYIYESCESLLNGYITPSLCWCFMLFVAFAVTTNIQPHWCTCTVCAFSWSASKSLTWHYREQLFNVFHANVGISQFCTIRSPKTSIICKLMSLWLLTRKQSLSNYFIIF